MRTYRVKFRAERDRDELIRSDSMNESSTSYQFYDDGGNLVAQIPRDVVLFVTEEKAG